MANISLKLFGKRLKNPVMNASGTLGYSNEIESLWKIETLGAYVTKGLSLKPHHGNPTPRIWDERHGMINSIGLQNMGLDRFFDEHFPFFQKKKTPIIINFFGFTEEEYIAFAAKVKPDRLIVALEMNLSCPNIKAGGISFGKDPQMVFEIVKKVKAVTQIPLIAKLTPEVKNIVDIGRAAFEAGADGLTLINTMPAAIVEVKKKESPYQGGTFGAGLETHSASGGPRMLTGGAHSHHRCGGHHECRRCYLLSHGRRKRRSNRFRDVCRPLYYPEGHSGNRQVSR